jgi:hypothetical protein
MLETGSLADENCGFSQQWSHTLTTHCGHTPEFRFRTLIFAPKHQSTLYWQYSVCGTNVSVHTNTASKTRALNFEEPLKIHPTRQMGGGSSRTGAAPVLGKNLKSGSFAERGVSHCPWHRGEFSPEYTFTHPTLGSPFSHSLRAIRTVLLDPRDPLLRSERTQGFTADPDYWKGEVFAYGGLPQNLKDLKDHELDSLGFWSRLILGHLVLLDLPLRSRRSTHTNWNHNSVQCASRTFPCGRVWINKIATQPATVLRRYVGGCRSF